MIVNLILTLLGTALCFAGVWLIYPPAAIVGLGVALIVVGLMREDGSDGETGRPADQA